MVMQSETSKSVALIGRPNVGKSTLFNRLIGKRMAIETEVPGTTRDRLYGDVTWAGQHFTLIDVAGVESSAKTEIDANIQEGIDIALESADLILFVVDWNDKDNDADKRIASRLRRIDKPVILVASKADNIERITNIDEFKRLGNFDIFAVSGINGKNSGDLLDKVVEELYGDGKSILPKKKDNILGLAIIGRPNVGKSTLINAFLNQKRAIVSAEAGTTRDTVATEFGYKGRTIQLFDTAGIRRRGKIEKDTIESFSVLRAYRAMQQSDIVLLVIDAEEGLVANDAHILGKAMEWGKGIVLVVNKIDLWGEKDEKEEMGKVLYYLSTHLNFIPWLPVVFISAQDKKNIEPVLSQVFTAERNRSQLFDQEQLDQFLAQVKDANPQLDDLSSIRQTGTKPPAFRIKYKKKAPHATQMRYLENKMRDIFPLNGTPVFLDLFSSKDGFGKKSKR